MYYKKIIKKVINNVLELSGATYLNRAWTREFPRPITSHDRSKQCQPGNLLEYHVEAADVASRTHYGSKD